MASWMASNRLKKRGKGKRMMIIVRITMAALVGAALCLPAAGVSEEAPAAAPAAAAETVKSFGGPALVTDIGQGNTGKLVEVMLRKSAAVEFTADPLAKADALAGVKTLVVGVGASTKGLGAAGLDSDQEMARGKELLAKAKELGIPVIGVHIGGEARRGEMSDSFNRMVCESSAVFIVWKGGDEDGFFKAICEEKNIRYEVVEAKPAAGAVLATLFGKAAASPAE